MLNIRSFLNKSNEDKCHLHTCIQPNLIDLPVCAVAILDRMRVSIE